MEIANSRKFIEKLDTGLISTLALSMERVVVKHPVILICNETTSELDAESDKKVQKALDKVMENRSGCRFAPFKHAEVIYVFDAVEIKESGTTIRF